VEKGAVTRAFLGVTLDARFTIEAAQAAGLQQRIGARVVTVIPDSPAAQAGIQAGDIILRYDTTLVESDGHLINLVNTSDVGKEVTLEIVRAGQVQKVKVVLTPKPATPPTDRLTVSYDRCIAQFRAGLLCCRSCQSLFQKFKRLIAVYGKNSDHSTVGVLVIV